jgi:RNA polymerase-binding transcription factor DksA
MAKSKKKNPAKKSSGKPTKPARKSATVKTKPVRTAKPTVKPSSAKSKAKPSPKHKPVTKPAPKSKAAPKPAPTKAKAVPVKPTAKPASLSMEKTSKKNALRVSILARKAAAKPIGFSLDEVRAIAKTVSTKSIEDKPSAKSKATAAATSKALAAAQKPAKPNHVQAASLADILGFNPNKPKEKAAPAHEKPVAEKHKRYYKLLLDLREHLSAGIELHSEETLKRSAKDDAGDLSSYGQHMADAGTDTFDRDFALSLVSSEQEALSEIELAIKRIHDGTYGICEITGEPIAKDRLLAVPFTRYSTEAQKQIERNRHRTRTQAGLFGEHGEDSGKMMDSEDGND